MPIVLLRLDERLIHGQVVVGWAAETRPDRFMVVDDELAGAEWEQELYRLAVDFATEVAFVSVRDGRSALPAWFTDARRTVVLLRDVDALGQFAEGDALKGQTINLGGLHHRGDRTPVLPYLYLSREEMATLQRLAAAGLPVMAQDVPTARPVPLADLAEKALGS